MNTLGIYFGLQVISIVETKDRLPINNIQIPRSAISIDESLKEKLPQEVKIVALLGEELTAHKIEARETTISLSGKDLIVRTFEMPILPREELESAVNFEVKKYIPFKIEELISDFQAKLDKSSRKNHILFVGIKRETLDRYISIIEQLGLKITSIEYSAYSILRLLNLANIKEKGVVAVVNIDFKEGDEVNFVVLEDGFPLFSRDIIFTSGPEDTIESKELRSEIILEKLKREIRISLDYHERKLPLKSINKVFIITDLSYSPNIEGFFTFIKDKGLNIQFIDVDKYVGRAVPFSLSFIKSYSSSLSKINAPVKINLLLAKERASKEIGIVPSKAKEFSLIARFKLEFMLGVSGLLICVATFLFVMYRMLPLKKDLESIIAMRPTTSTVSPGANYKELVSIDSDHKTKVRAIDNVTKKQLHLAGPLDVIPRVVPKGIRLVNLSFRKKEDRIELILQGAAYRPDNNLELINTLLSNLKESPSFTKNFKNIDIVSVDQSPKTNMVNFIISCSDYETRGTK